jgi:hypothetical protein
MAIDPDDMKRIREALEGVRVPRVDPDTLRAMSEMAARVRANYPDPETLRTITEAVRESTERVRLSDRQIEALSRPFPPETIGLFAKISARVAPDESRQILDQLRQSASLRLTHPQAAAITDVAEGVVAELNNDERAQLEQASYGVRDVIAGISSDERQALLERVGGAILTVIGFFERLASQGESPATLIALTNVLWVLYGLHALVQRTIDAVERREEEEEPD